MARCTSPSHSTEPEAVAKFKAFAEAHSAAWFWDGAGDNPYFCMLALSDAMIATEDSVSRGSEAVATGKPVATVALKGWGAGHGAFIETLTERGIISRFDGTFPIAPKTTMPNATEIAATRIWELFREKAGINLETSPILTGD